MSRFAVWPQPFDWGAEFCNQYEDQLTKLEPTVKDYWKYIAGRYNRNQTKELIAEFKARCLTDLNDYIRLLLQISIKAASQQMKKPLGLRDSHIIYLEPADLLIKPWDTEAIVDDTDEPLLIVKHNKIRFDRPFPVGNEIDPAMRLEMACRMHAASITRFQSLYMNGITAVLRFAQVPDVDSIFCDGQTRLDFARYRMPQDRNGFVCHLVNLLKNSDDYEKYYKYKCEILKAMSNM